jgi:acyl carrier protein
MELKDFLEHLNEQFDFLEPLQLTRDVRFKEFDEYSSLTALMIITMIDEEYGVTVSGDDMVKVSTVGELFDLVSSRI